MTFNDLPGFAPLAHLQAVQLEPGIYSYLLSIVARIPPGYKIQRGHEKGVIEGNTYYYKIFTQQGSNRKSQPYLNADIPINTEGKDLEKLEVSIFFDGASKKTVLKFELADKSPKNPLLNNGLLLTRKPYGYLLKNKEGVDQFSIYYAYFFEGEWANKDAIVEDVNTYTYVGIQLNYSPYISNYGMKVLDKPENSKFVDLYISILGVMPESALQPVTNGGSIYDYEDADE